MNNAQIIAEIQRTAKGNDGVPLGWRRFEAETGIGYYDWYGQFWTRWSDAVRQAGFEPNRMTEAACVQLPQEIPCSSLTLQV